MWEGIFTVRSSAFIHFSQTQCLSQYTEFTSYAALLSGAAPAILHRSLVAQHRQTLKIQEWHLVEDEDESIPSRVRPLRPGNACRGYIPDELKVHEVGDTLELTELGGKEPLVYRSWASIRRSGLRCKVLDTFLTGQVREII